MDHQYCYHVPIDWRRAKFFLSHPSVIPECDGIITVPVMSTFVSCDKIVNVLSIRDWLHAMAVRYRLIACHEITTSLLCGIVFAFNSITDLMLFQTHWIPLLQPLKAE